MIGNNAIASNAFGTIKKTQSNHSAHHQLIYSYRMNEKVLTYKWSGQQVNDKLFGCCKWPATRW
jgi:hypothetical protein